ncbi:glutaminyl-peptide cyclotransferase [Sinomicrobium weinanense]|uniref:Glutaminyl-peptide cyclotransferase n=1 Tax=Sinomicrobium weinanense TaxID=2842200 RepID=A0A926Q509_9FLAO|nr:glutaminyl-peptide cyclotransferase [Sinomicrobium weinanense]MBC9797651.1 glutaminyl-peptide cyclotransferase [Sinomicrobium weinanense]MBU3122667.1 glutaminyl-peptide cyclotransferase [Sinomicrobium weinanense]
MKMLKWLTINMLLCFFMACNGNKTSKKFSIRLGEGQEKVKYNHSLKADIVNRKKLEIDSVAYSIDGNRLHAEGNELLIKDIHLGHQTLDAVIYYEGTSEKISKTITVLSEKAPKIYTYTILNEYPHDDNAFTQGLEFYKDTLYESTGRNGQSSLRKVDYKTGKVLKKKDLKDEHFGEGLTIMNDKIYQLTWRAKIGFVYDMAFNKIKDFSYGHSKEGWGLCNDGTRIYKSDGTEKIWILDPETLEEKDHIETVTNTSVFSRANELEYARGKIYANTWQKDGVMIINPETGAIEGVVDFRGLKKKVTQSQNLDVLNGIAYHSGNDSFFITGKNWDKIFEVKIVEKKE